MNLGIKLSNEKALASLIILVIVAAYLHPAFFGKVDTPIDIRNVLMYPWRYHENDKKVKRFILWQIRKESENLVLGPGAYNEKKFEIKLDENNLLEIKKSKEKRFYTSSRFKINAKTDLYSTINVFLFNNLNKEFVPIPFSIAPLAENSYVLYADLNNFINNLNEIEKLSYYSFVLRVKNITKKTLNIFLNKIQLICDDYSLVPSVHNFFLNDLIQMFTPYREYYSKSIKQGGLPFWSNYTLTGIEFLAEPQLGYLHPLYLLLYFIFDHFTAHTIIVFVGMFSAGFGVFILSRFWEFSFVAALFTSIVYIFNPFCVTWLSYEHVLINVATLPYLLLAYEKHLKCTNFLNKYLLASALLLGLIFVSGHLQKVYYTIMFFTFFVFFRMVTQIVQIKKHLFSFLFVFLFGLMIGSVVLVPFFPFFLNSVRMPLSEEFIRKNAFPLKALFGIIYPYYGGSMRGTHTSFGNLDPVYSGGFFNNYVYFGFLPFLFSIFCVQKLFKKDKLVIFFLVTILISLLIVTASPFFYFVRNLLPGFKHMQFFRFLMIYALSVPFLAGIGVQVFLNNFFVKRFVAKNKLGKLLVFLIFLITTADLMYYSSYFMTWSKRKEYKPVHKNGSIEFLLKKQKESKEPFRVLSFSVGRLGQTNLKINSAQPNTLMPYEIEEVSGYSSFVPKDIYNLFIYVQTKDPTKIYKKEIIDLFENPNIPYPIYNFKSKVLDLLNVKYFLVPPVLTLEDKSVKEVYKGDSRIYENLDALPRAFLVSEYKVIESDIDTIVYIDSDKFDPLKVVILMSEPPVIARNDEVTMKQSRSHGRESIWIASSQQVAPRNDIQFLKYEPENIKLRVKADKSGFLVLGHNLNNNWKVRINGREEKHFQANLVQRAVYLPEAGNYIVEFYYFPKLFFIGLSVTLSALFLLLFLACILILSRK